MKPTLQTQRSLGTSDQVRAPRRFGESRMLAASSTRASRVLRRQRASRIAHEFDDPHGRIAGPGSSGVFDPRLSGDRSCRLSDGTGGCHVEADEVVDLAGTGQRELSNDGFNESGDQHRCCFVLGEPAGLHVEQLFFVDA